MTIDDRYVVDLDELKILRFECKACGTAVVVQIKDWMGNLATCPACGVVWFNLGGPHGHTITQLANGLRGTMALLKESNFRVRLEIDRPKG
jgi:ribosomal protein S27AE